MPIYKPYQKEGILRIRDCNFTTLLADDMGLGKSIQSAGAYYRYLFPDGPMVIVCPGNIKWNWQNELTKHFDQRSLVLETTRPPKDGFGYGMRSGVYIINYDILYAWSDWLIAQKPLYLIGDEAHKLRNSEARWTQAFRHLARHVPYRVLCTGTPQMNRPWDLYPLLNILWPKQYADKMDFGNKYCGPTAERGKVVFKGATNLPELNQELLDNGMIRRRKEDVLKDLPKKSRFVETVAVDDIRKYNETAIMFREWAKANENWNVGNRMAEALKYMTHMKQLAATLKMPSIIEWIENFLEEDNGKLIVFGIHRAILKPLHARFENSVLVDGSVTGRNRQRAVDQFTHDKRTRLFIGNMVAAGLGWNGVAASTSVTVEFPWEPATLNQCEGRLDRIGQTKPVFCYYLVAKGTIEEPMCRIIQAKQRTADTVIDGAVDSSGLAVFHELVQSVLGSGK